MKSKKSTPPRRVNTTGRYYSPTTLKLLYALSGNECACPECTHPIVSPKTQYSDAAIVAQICHIYAAADNGPRGKPDLTRAQRNAFDNLILLCGHHHPIVDKQHETYPAETLKQWKSKHEAQFQLGTAEAIRRQTSMQQMAFLQAYSDQQIEAEIEAVRKARFLNNYPSLEKATELAARIERTELAGGSSDTRARGLAWCARWLSQPATSERAWELLGKSKQLAMTTEAVIAEAFIEANDNRDKALALLAGLTVPAARSAALRIMTNSDKAVGAIAWAEKAGLTLESFDSEGKLLHITNELGTGRWEQAAAHASEISAEDKFETPVLNHAIGMACLVQTVPPELRAPVMLQVPFEARRFPLAADAASVELRRQAIAAFRAVSEFAQSLGVATTSNPASDYALWLALRDPRDHDQGMEELRASMRDASQSLRRLYLALQFGIKLDLAAIEQEIDRRVALSGIGTSDEAFARFTLAFTKANPDEVAEYIGRHRRQLYEHLQKGSVETIEIEMLARGGQIAAAQKRFSAAIAEGLGEVEQQRLTQILAEAAGADPAAGRKKSYEETGQLTDLVNLVAFLEEEKSWHELYPFAIEIFQKTHALEDAFRIARVLEETAQYGKLLDFLEQNSALTVLSSNLRTMLAWSLFREGQFNGSYKLLRELAASRDDPTDHTLRVNLAIASGNWDDLVDFTNAEWNSRDQRSAPELMRAAQLAQAVRSPHAKELLKAAAEKAPDDPDLLAGAYFQAVSAGFEDDAPAGQWLQRAAELSGENGPLQKMSMKELLDRKPDWDRRETSVWEQLREGKMPVFGAGHLLRRSLTDLVLAQSLGNLTESDPRRRSVIYAFSGARAPSNMPKVDTVALDLTSIFAFALLDLLPVLLDTYQLLIPHSTLGWLFEERHKISFHQPSRVKDAHSLKQLVASSALKVLPTQPLTELSLGKEVGLELARMLLAARRKGPQDTAPRYVIRPAPVHRAGSLMEEEADLSAYEGAICSCQAVVEKLRAKGLLTHDEERRALSYLRLHERRWPVEPNIEDGADLYLDDLSVIYLQSAGVLGKLKAAGLNAYIAEDYDSDANRLIGYEGLAAKQLEIIERIRKILAEGLKSGRVRALRTKATENEDILASHPTFGILGLEEAVDAFVIDDRFVNRHAHMDSNSGTAPILTSLDLLDDLAAKGAISRENVFAHRARLRLAGLQLIPVTEGELAYHLNNTEVRDGKVVETAELRAIREALLQARMRKLIQIPLETPWLHGSTRAVIQTIRGLWKEGAALSEAAAYAEWLLSLLDIRGWAPSAVKGNERNFALFGYGAHLHSLMSPPDGAPGEVRDAYYAWMDRRLIQEVRETEPEIFAWMVDRSRELIAQLADKTVKDFGA